MIILGNGIDQPYIRANDSTLVVTYGREKPKFSVRKSYKPISRAVYSWLSKLSPKERQAVLSETCPAFTQIFRQILQKQQGVKGRLSFSAVYKDSAVGVETKQQEFWKREKSDPEQEKLLYTSVRLFSKDTYLDSITVCRKFVENINVLMECIEVVSAGRSFWNSSNAKEGGRITQSISERGKQKGQGAEIYDKFPHWFCIKEGGTAYEWLCAFFEQIIFNKYSVNNYSRPYTLPDIFLELSNLVHFWNELAYSSKVKIIEEFEKFHFLSSTSNLLDATIDNVSSKGKDAAVLDRKELLFCAAVCTDTVQFIDALLFNSLDLASDSLAGCAHKFLNFIKLKLRESITEQLIQEVDVSSPKKSSKGTPQESSSRRKDCIEDKYELIRKSETYKSLFVQEVSVVPVMIAGEKKKRKKKHKKSKLQQQLDKPTPSKEEETALDDDNPIVKEEIKASAKVIEEVESNTKENSESSVNEDKEVLPVLVRRTDSPKKSHSTSDESKPNKTIKKKKRRASKGEALMKKEYEELRIRAQQFFTATTSSCNKDKSKKTKRNKKKAEAGESVKKAPRKTSAFSTVSVVSNSSSSKKSETQNELPKGFASLVTEEETKEENPKRTMSGHISEYEKVEELIHDLDTGNSKAETAPNNELFLEPPIFYDPFYLNEDHKKNIEKLNVEIKRVMDDLDVFNDALYSICEPIRKAIECQAFEVFPELKSKLQAFIYGSAVTGLALEDSDIDITLLSTKANTNDDYMESVGKFGNALKMKEFVVECKIITTARVPVIKLVVDLCKMGIQFIKQKIKVDVTIGDEVFRPLVGCGVVLSDWIIDKICMFPMLKPLILLAKRLLYHHGLNTTYYGGLSSCTLILMISAFFNTCPPLPTIGHLFLELLRYYGCVFQSDQMMIAEGEYIVMGSEARTLSEELCVMDLFQPSVNAAASVTKFDEIRTLFQRVYEALQNGDTSELAN